MAHCKANGIDIEYESFGREDAPAVLLIAGIVEQLTGWPDSLCTGLAAKGYRVIRFDNRDIGKTTHLNDLVAPTMPEMMVKLMSGQKIDASYTLTDMAGDAVGLLDGLGIADAHVVGMSMGGMIAQLVAIHHPQRTRSLVSLMSTSGRRGLPPPRPDAMAAMMARPATPEREARIAVFTKFFRTVAGPGFRQDDAELRAYVERQVDRAVMDPAAMARQTAALLAAEPRHELLRTVRAPSLVIHGADDPLAPVAGGKDTADCIPGAELVVVPGMGHDFSEAVVEKVLLPHIGEFFARVEAARKLG